MTTDTTDENDNSPVFAPDDFGISVEWDGDDVVVNHFDVDPDLRGKHLGSAIIETIKRIYYYEGADRLIVRMGGGEAAEAFLERNGFEVTERRPYSQETAEIVGCPFGVTAVYDYTD